jgi:hypothetical protein
LFFFLISITKLLPPFIVQLRLIQDSPLISRLPWSIEQFYIFHIHSQLQWFASEDTKWNSTFLTLTNSTDDIIHETKDVYFNRDYILQIEFNYSNFTNNNLEYSSNLGLTWLQISNENEIQIIPIRFSNANVTFYRLTIPFDFISSPNNSIRFRFFNHLQYVYIGTKCLMNCFGMSHCNNGECKTISSSIPLVCKN